MSAPTTLEPAVDLERLEAAFLRSPSATWPVSAPVAPAPVDVPPSAASDEDLEEYKMTIVRTQRYCCV